MKHITNVILIKIYNNNNNNNNNTLLMLIQH